MMKKILLYLVLVICIPRVVHTMELVQKVEQLASSPEAKDIEGKVIGFVQSPTGQNIIKEVEDKAVSLFSHKTATTTTTTATTSTTTTTSTVPTIVVSNPVANTVIAQNNVALNQSSSSVQPSVQVHDQTSKTQVPNLNLNSSTLAPTRAESTVLQPKTPVKLNQLEKHVRKATGQSARNNTPLPSTRNTSSAGNNSQDVVIDMGFVQKSVSPPHASNQASDIATKERTYTVDEVWDMFKEVKPELVKFADENKLPLEQAIVFGSLLKKYNVSPETVVEHINKKKLPEDKKTAIPVAEYKKIQKNDPNKYKGIILEILKDISEEQEQEGQTTSSPLTDTHIDLLEGQVATDKNTKLYQWAALAVTVFSGLGGFAWAIYGQVTKSATVAPTFAPTIAPTFAPTFSPTGSPT
jgi:hypothetical protein